MPMTREEYRRAFERWDENQNGKLTLCELHALLNSLLNTTASDMAVKS